MLANGRIRGSLCEAQATAHSATITVFDDGPGFADGAPDPQSDGGVSHTPGVGSTGLGLGIVHDILSEYGAGLRVERAEGLCSVSFTLPADATTEEQLAPAPGVAGEPKPSVRALPKIA